MRATPSSALSSDELDFVGLNLKPRKKAEGRRDGTTVQPLSEQTTLMARRKRKDEGQFKTLNRIFDFLVSGLT